VVPATFYTYTVVAVNRIKLTAPSDPLVVGTNSVIVHPPIPRESLWYELDHTKMRPLCPSEPSLEGYVGCAAVTNHHSGGAFDTKRNRLIIWGAGDGRYYGNEMYALDMNTLQPTRLTDPGLPPAPKDACVETLVNGMQPNSRSTEDGMTYMPNVDRLIVVGGTRACHVGGRGTQSIWTFDFDTKTWREMQPSGPLPARSFTIATAYDPNTGRVFIYDGASLYAYDFIQNRMQKLSAKQERADEVSGVIDPVRKQFLAIGSGKVVVYAIGPNSTYTPQVIQTVGGDSVVNALRPGLAYAS